MFPCYGTLSVSQGQQSIEDDLLAAGRRTSGLRSTSIGRSSAWRMHSRLGRYLTPPRPWCWRRTPGPLPVGRTPGWCRAGIITLGGGMAEHAQIEFFLGDTRASQYWGIGQPASDRTMQFSGLSWMSARSSRRCSCTRSSMHDHLRAGRLPARSTMTRSGTRHTRLCESCVGVEANRIPVSRRMA